MIQNMQNTEMKTNMWSCVSGLIMVAMSLFFWFAPEKLLQYTNVTLGIALLITGAVYMKTYFSWTYGWSLAIGLTNIAVGIIFATNLGLPAGSFSIVFALWAIFVGIIQIASSSHLRNTTYRWAWMMAAGFLGILFGFLIIGFPIFGIFSLPSLMATYLLIYGAMEIMEACLKKDVNIKL